MQMQKKQKVITITCSCAEHPCKMHTQDTCIRIMYHLVLIRTVQYQFPYRMSCMVNSLPRHVEGTCRSIHDIPVYECAHIHTIHTCMYVCMYVQQLKTQIYFLGASITSTLNSGISGCVFSPVTSRNFFQNQSCPSKAAGNNGFSDRTFAISTGDIVGPVGPPIVPLDPEES